MILGRPTNLWLGVVTALAGGVTVALVAAGVDPELVANAVGAGVTALGAIIALVAYQPPTLAPGDKFITETPAGQPNYETTVAKPPAPSRPYRVEDDEGAARGVEEEDPLEFRG